MFRFTASCSAAVLFILTAPFARAGDIKTDGMGALMFNYEGLFTSTPTALDNVGIGGRIFMSPGLAIRAAVGLSLDTEKTEVSGASEEASTNQLNAEVGAEFVLTRGRSAYLYTGGLLQVSKFEDDPEGGSNNTDRLDIAVAALLGVTYFVVEGLSVGAEYRLGFGRSTETKERDGDNLQGTQTAIGASTIGFHLGFWFD